VVYGPEGVCAGRTWAAVELPYAVVVPYWKMTVPGQTSGLKTDATTCALVVPILGAFVPMMIGGATS
jgi:hypothetical protein